MTVCRGGVCMVYGLCGCQEWHSAIRSDVGGVCMCACVCLYLPVSA